MNHKQMAEALARRKLQRAGIDPDKPDEPAPGTVIPGADEPLNPDDDGQDPDHDEDGQDPDRDTDQDPDYSPSGGNDPDTAAELAELRAQLAQRDHEIASLSGRLTPAQQRLSEVQALAQTYQTQLQQTQAEARAEIERLQAQLEENSRADAMDLLTPEERELFDPAALQAIVRLSDELVKRRVPNLDVDAAVNRRLAEVRKQEIEAHRQAALSDPKKGIHDLYLLSERQDFREWCNKEENEDFSLHVNALLTATTTADIDKHTRAIAKRLNQFKAPQTSRAAADPRQSLHDKMRRKPTKGLTQAEVDAKLAEAKALTRQGRFKEAKAIHDSLN